MKAETQVIEVESTLTGEWIGMTIDAASTHHLMSILTDLYSDPELAIIREYSTNAFDAHVEALVTRPIEVTTPSALAPFFRVRDYGFGLNANDIREIYSRYGASTKRESNDVVGMLGLGCKSALTYTNQFTIMGIKDGICTHVSVTRDEDGGGSMTIVSEEETDEPSGVEIIVPTKQGNRIEAKAAHFFAFWKHGTVLVNGAWPKRVNGTWLSENLLLTQETDCSYVVMGNVAYAVPPEWDSSQKYNFSGGYYNYFYTVAFVDIGTVNFTPSREQLHLTKKTKDTLENVKQRVATERVAAVERQLDAAATKVEALALYHSVAKKMGVNAVKYKGVDIPDGYRVLDVKDKNGKVTSTGLPFLSVNKQARYRSKSWSQERVILSEDWSNVVWIAGWPGGDFSAYKRKKLEQWLAKQNLGDFSRFVFIDAVPQEILPWINTTNVVFPWAAIDAEKIVRDTTTKLQNGRISGTYPVMLPGEAYEKDVLAADLDQTKPIFYTTKIQGWTGQGHLRTLVPDASIVMVNLNRLKKFERDFPTAQKMSVYLQGRAKAWGARLTEEDKLTLAYEGSSYETVLNSLDPARLDDEDLAKLVTHFRTNKRQLRENWNMYRYFDHLNIEPSKRGNPLEKYPLLTSGRSYGTMSGVTKDHAHLYINAVYAAGKDS